MFSRKPMIGIGLCAALVLASTARSQPPNMTALHDALHLSANQEAAWSAYKASVSPSVEGQQRRRAAAMLFPQLTAPRRIDLVQAEMRRDLADLQRQAAALDALYATLSASQQKTFDAKTLPPRQDGANSDR